MFQCRVTAHLKAASAFPALPGTFRSRSARSSSRPSLSLVFSCTYTNAQTLCVKCTRLSRTYMISTLPWWPLEALQAKLYHGAHALLSCKCPKQEDSL